MLPKRRVRRVHPHTPVGVVGWAGHATQTKNSALLHTLHRQYTILLASLFFFFWRRLVFSQFFVVENFTTIFFGNPKNFPKQTRPTYAGPRRPRPGSVASSGNSERFSAVVRWHIYFPKTALNENFCTYIYFFSQSYSLNNLSYSGFSALFPQKLHHTRVIHEYDRLFWEYDWEYDELSTAVQAIILSIILFFLESMMRV